MLSREWLETIERRHRGGGVDGCNRTRAEVVHAINHFTNGSDVFIHTDAAYQNDIPLFDHVVASRFTEEDGGNPATANSGNRGGLYVQWWRLSRAWNLLVEYEQQCAYAHEGREYKFVMKMRTDMNLYGDWKLATLYKYQVVPRFSQRMVDDGKDMWLMDVEVDLNHHVCEVEQAAAWSDTQFNEWVASRQLG